MVELQIAGCPTSFTSSTKQAVCQLSTFMVASAQVFAHVLVAIGHQKHGTGPVDRTLPSPLIWQISRLYKKRPHTSAALRKTW